MRKLQSLEESLRARVACLELVDHICDKIIMVGARETNVGETFHIFPVLDGVANGIFDGVSLSWVTQFIICTNPHGDGNFIDAGKRDLFSLVAWLVILLELLEALFDRALSVMKGGLHG